METNYDTIGQHCEVFSGYAFKSQDLLSEGDIPVVKIGNISNGKDILIDKDTQYVDKKFLSINDKYHIKKGDVLISLTGSHINQPNSMVGRSCRYYQDQVLLLNQRAGKILPKDNNDLSFLYYVFSSWAMKVSITNRAYGAANQVNVSPSDILNIKFHFPDYITQQKIAHILSRYDEAIENNNKRIKLLEQMAQNLYKEWFVRFRFPGYENCEFENGIPVGWKVERLFDIANVTYGYAFASELFCEDKTLNPVVRIRDILYNQTNTCTSEVCADKYIIKEHEILVGMDGIFHMCMWNGKKAYQNQRVVKLTPKTEDISNYFLFLAVQPQVKFWEQTIAGTTVAHLGDKHLKRMTILLPSENLLKKSTKIFNSLMKQKNQLFIANENLAKQRDLLLPRLMSGKVEV
ncbi:MAG: restriction endonuclease subunit S [Spirochaetaceae bacterium]|nr:restriction endonuclease subunit S [Spirochaetaceae bacterium]